MSASSPPTQFRSGLLFGVIAYACWGAVPLYFWQVKHVPALEILAHRISWSLPLLLGVVAFLAGLFPALRATRVDPLEALRVD